jgi:hypothetical protein
MLPEPGSCGDWREQKYSNRLDVGYNSVEFVLRFSQERVEDRGRPVVEVVTNPAFAKAFSETLASAVHRFENRFGRIPETEDAD